MNCGYIMCNTLAFFLAPCKIFNMQVALYIFLILLQTLQSTNNLKSWGWLFYTFDKKMSHCHTTTFYMKFAKIEFVQRMCNYLSLDLDLICLRQSSWNIDAITNQHLLNICSHTARGHNGSWTTSSNEYIANCLMYSAQSSSEPPERKAAPVDWNWPN
jgi:hypothetical protein